ncbi:hypothetical protein ES332_D09G026200v1 [Gossypium tomentosum]|uniref:AP2/ERF domain-containing protein n=1 Tax=Gossypium tomentosum TaxID=34277 RepID=A0A5D2JDJ9_GOSTO|nr:hypothetical protein ES332_D09G026200v1 [Gossypium tomentosum]
MINDDNQGMQQNYQSSNVATTVKRSSRFRGVSRHRWTGKYEAHLCLVGRMENLKGKSAYDDEEVAARAYDLAALKYWGTSTSTNFPIWSYLVFMSKNLLDTNFVRKIKSWSNIVLIEVISYYEKEIEIMQTVTKEEFLASLRRKSSGFSRGVSKHYYHNGRWEARIGREFGNKYLNLGSYNTQEEAARAYDIAAIKCRGINAVTNFDLSTYAGWLRPELTNNTETESVQSTSCYSLIEQSKPSIHYPFAVGHFNSLKQEHAETKLPVINVKSYKSSSPTALSLLLRSSVFQELVEKNANNRK